jgi:hypothetical protein
MHEAVLRRDPKLLQLLLERGASVRAPDGLEPYAHLVVRTIAALLQTPEQPAEGEDPGNDDGEAVQSAGSADSKPTAASPSARDVAIESSRSILRVLRDFKYPFTIEAPREGTCLHLAISGGCDVGTVQALLDVGCDPRQLMVDHEGVFVDQAFTKSGCEVEKPEKFTARQLAERVGRIELLPILI